MINVNMEKARNIKREMLRLDRLVMLSDLDVSFMRAVEKGDVKLQADIAAEKQRLRDVTTSIEIEEAQTPEELKALDLLKK